MQVISANNALIYCDLISQQFVGSQYVRCLRTLIQPTTYCNHIFENVYYMPVEKCRFQDIQIHILGLDGTPVDFTESDVPTKIVLHFRRVSTYKYQCPCLSIFSYNEGPARSVLSSPGRPRIP
jgi:hypothetical protein